MSVDNTRGCVVVGVDGSAPSRAALAWAAEEAKFRNLPLDVVYAWSDPINPELEWPTRAELAQDAEREVNASIRSVLGEHPSIEIRTSLLPGPANHVLRDKSDAATLLVVGNRGHGEFAGILLGSVSEFLASHSRCPVLIVRSPQERSGHGHIRTPHS